MAKSFLKGRLVVCDGKMIFSVFTMAKEAER